MEARIKSYFGKEISKADRENSYSLIESFINDKVSSWDTPPDTDALALAFSQKIKALSDEDLAFLLLHSGYIPDVYEPDSSQETLYTKLIEVLVCEWAIRVGFTQSVIQKQKSSKEDVTISVNDKVIVTDAKSFRLGRSQAAPNVKDTIKKADYEKWLSAYDEDKRVGGLITFPSLHNWSRGSDAYLYCTDATEPIVLFFYEHLAFYLLKKIKSAKLIGLYDDYATVFPNTSKDKTLYFNKVSGYIFNEHLKEWSEFSEFAKVMVQERVTHAMLKLVQTINSIQEKVKEEVEKTDEKLLREQLIQSKTSALTSELDRLLANIAKFRVKTYADLSDSTEETPADKEDAVEK